MNTTTIIKAVGTALMAFVFWHTMQVWGLLLAAAFAMILLP